jgi:formyltetrahydrofolate deformylase
LYNYVKYKVIGYKLIDYKLLIDAKDSKGLMHKVLGILLEHDISVDKNDEFVDIENSKFFMRTEFQSIISRDKLLQSIKSSLDENVNIRLIEKKKKDIIIMATKEAHVLGELLVRYYDNKLDANILAVISNYDYLKPLVEKFDIPFFNIEAKDLEREEHEKLVLDKLDEFEFDYIVLAKYMRILTPNFVDKHKDKIINIHHSFLPAFIGANPYKQAFQRGVKIIGATAHFVTNDLDEGPIIYQDTTSVNHSYNWRDMQKAGQDIEKIVLAKALNLALEDRIFIYENKTIIF